MRSNPVTIYATIGVVCGGTASTAQAVFAHQPAGATLVAAAIGSVTGAVVGALYGYVKLRRAANR